MGRRPVVISPIAPLLRREGGEVALVSVELWPQQTIVRLAALVDEPVAEEEAFGAALDAWAKGGRREPLPSEPGDSIYRQVSITVTDDLGTAYFPKSSAVGGTGRLFRGDWYFSVGVPQTAARLMIEALDAGGQLGRMDLELEVDP